MRIGKGSERIPEIAFFAAGLVCLVLWLFTSRIRFGSVVIADIQLWYAWLVLAVLSILVAIGREGADAVRRGFREGRGMIAILDALPYAGAVAIGLWCEVALLARMFGR